MILSPRKACTTSWWNCKISNKFKFNMNPIQEYFYRLEEPERSTLLFLREKILESDTDNITETLSFGLPFFKYKKRMLCYFNFSKKHKKYYISFEFSRHLS